MSNISTWSNVAASNTGTAPDFLSEGCAPSSVNDAFRELQAALRRWYEDAQWVDLGYTYARLSASQFTIAGDYRTTFEVGRRVKMTGSATSYGTVSAVSYTAPDTTVTIGDNTIPGTLATVAVSILTPSNGGFPGVINSGPTDFAAAGVRISGAAVPTTGAGLDLAYQSGIGYLSAFSNDDAAYTTLTLRTGALGVIQNNGVSGFTLTESGGEVTLGLPETPTVTSASAGAASALPATPLGYLKATINGTDVRIPYYAA